MNMISMHYNMHPSCNTSLSSGQIKQNALAEVKDTYDTPSHKPLFLYLMENWYAGNGTCFESWGRRDVGSGIPFARTTMYVEGHWSLLKRNFLLYYNRPRIDFLLYIINSRLLPKFHDDLEMLKIGKKLPLWYKSFCKEWDTKAATAPSGQSYVTLPLQWMCSCPSFYLSKYFLCKHLCSSASRPECRDIQRNNHAPFWVFGRVEGRRYPLFEKPISCTRDISLLPSPQNSPPLRDFIPPTYTCDLTASLDAERVGADVAGLAYWFDEHVRELRSNNAGQKQLMHLANSVLPRLYQYRTDVENNKNSRRAPQTWGNRNTLYLP